MLNANMKASVALPIVVEEIEQTLGLKRFVIAVKMDAGVISPAIVVTKVPTVVMVFACS